MSEFNQFSDRSQQSLENTNEVSSNHGNFVSEYMANAKDVQNMPKEGNEDTISNFLPPVEISLTETPEPTTLAGVGAEKLLNDFDSVDLDKDGYLRKGEIESYYKDASKSNPLEKEGLTRLMSNFSNVENQSNDQFGVEFGASKNDLHHVLSPKCGDNTVSNQIVTPPIALPVDAQPSPPPVESQPAPQPIDYQPAPPPVEYQPVQPIVVESSEVDQSQSAETSSPIELNQPVIDNDNTNTIDNNVSVIVNIPEAIVGTAPDASKESESPAPVEEPVAEKPPVEDKPVVEEKPEAGEKPAPPAEEQKPERNPIRERYGRRPSPIRDRYRQRPEAKPERETKPNVEEVRRRFDQLRDRIREAMRRGRNQGEKGVPYSKTEMGAQLLKDNFNKIDLDDNGLLEKDEVNKYRDRHVTSEFASNAMKDVFNNKEARNRSEDQSGAENSLSRKDIDLTIKHEQKLGKHDGYTTGRDSRFTRSRMAFNEHEFAAQVLKDNFDEINTDKGTMNTSRGPVQSLSLGEIENFIKNSDASKLEKDAVAKLIHDHRNPFTKGGNELLWNSKDGHSGRRGKLRRRRSREKEEQKGLTENDLNVEIEQHKQRGDRSGHPRR